MFKKSQEILQTQVETLSNKTNPFDFVKSVSYSKVDIMPDEIAEKSYQPFLVNRALSYHQDAIMFVNEMNCKHGVDNRLQYSFFISTLRKRNRFWSTQQGTPRTLPRTPPKPHECPPSPACPACPTKALLVDA